MTDRVKYSCKDGISTIALDDGKVNVMSTDMLKDIGNALDQAEQEGAVTILRSTRPNVFSAGFDLKVFAANDPEKSLEMVKTGAELALRLMSFPHPTIGVMQGHAFPMGTFLLLACDVRLAEQGPYKMGLNEVAIGISPPGFAIELARSRMTPSALNRTAVLGEMFEPTDAERSGLLDLVVAKDVLEQTLESIVTGVSAIHRPSHAIAKKGVRRAAMSEMRKAIDCELTLEAYAAKTKTPSTVVLPGGS